LNESQKIKIDICTEIIQIERSTLFCFPVFFVFKFSFYKKTNIGKNESSKLNVSVLVVSAESHHRWRFICYYTVVLKHISYDNCDCNFELVVDTFNTVITISH